MEAPEFYQNTSFCSQFNIPEKLHSNSDTNTANKLNTVDPFVVEDLLDFSNDDDIVAADAAFDSVTGHSTDSSSVNVVDTCNSSSLCGSETTNFVGDHIGCQNIADNHFSNDLCVPYDDLAELEWLSNFVEESFSSEDLQKLQLISGMKSRSTTVVEEACQTRQFQSEPNRNASVFYTDVSVPAKARSKRSRPAPCNWTSRLLLVSPTTTTTTTTTSETTSSSELDVVVSASLLPLPQPCTGKKTVKHVLKKKEGSEGGSGSCEGRKCLHCATDKTPQWRTGPMGPKTLCNACGVRYKSGRLVPEYRPAASPTFMLTKHSNSHRKVLELRRQKETLRHQQHQQFIQQQHHHQNMVFDVSSNGDDYLIHQHVGPDFRQLI